VDAALSYRPGSTRLTGQRHSGEGSASALEILQKLEQQRRDDDQSVEPRAAKSRMPEPEGGT
jgi:hypothetical protein